MCHWVQSDGPVFQIAVAWYYISGEVSLRESMNLTLDSEGLPVAQAGGQKKKQDDNSGDITIEYKDRTLLLEVTLMDKNAIKRGSGNQYSGIPLIFLLVALFRFKHISLLTLLIRTPKIFGVLWLQPI